MEIQIQTIVIVILFLLILFTMFINRREKEHFGSGAKFKITGRKDKCDCCGFCGRVYGTCKKGYSKEFCNRQKWACDRACLMSDYGA